MSACTLPLDGDNARNNVTMEKGRKESTESAKSAVFGTANNSRAVSSLAIGRERESGKL